MEQSIERINSGYRINSAKDNVSGLGVSEKMRAQIKGIQQASMSMMSQANMMPQQVLRLLG